MSRQVATVNVVASDPETQGPFVVINEDDFDAEVHQLYHPADEVKAATKAKKARGAAAQTNPEAPDVDR